MTDAVPAGLVPSNSLGRQPNWRQKLDEGIVDAGGEAPPKPPLPTGGSFTQKDPAAVFDDDSLEGQIARLEKRLRKNLPHDARANLELELEMLQDQKAMKDAGTAAPNSREPKAPVRRKPGATIQGPEETETPKQEKKKKLVNRAAPKIQHPQTMARMQDWKKELDRRIKEQEAIDGKSSSEPQPGWFNLPDWAGGSPDKEQNKRRSGGSQQDTEDGNPLAALQGAASAVVEALTGALGLNQEEQDEGPQPEARPLPKQTFSRRL